MAWDRPPVDETFVLLVFVALVCDLAANSQHSFVTFGRPTTLRFFSFEEGRYVGVSPGASCVFYMYDKLVLYV